VLPFLLAAALRLGGTGAADAARALALPGARSSSLTPQLPRGHPGGGLRRNAVELPHKVVVDLSFPTSTSTRPLRRRTRSCAGGCRLGLLSSNWRLTVAYDADRFADFESMLPGD
jgi:hypothetical protein